MVSICWMLPAACIGAVIGYACAALCFSAKMADEKLETIMKCSK